jgi:hypothetical protein
MPTIADLLAGKKIDYPSHSANVTFKQAPKTRTTRPLDNHFAFLVIPWGCSFEHIHFASCPWPPAQKHDFPMLYPSDPSDQHLGGQLLTRAHSSLYVNGLPVLPVSQVPLTRMVSP